MNALVPRHSFANPMWWGFCFMWWEHERRGRRH